MSVWKEDDVTMNNSDKIFVTGSEGFIGSHLTEALVRKGAKVKA